MSWKLSPSAITTRGAKRATARAQGREGLAGVVGRQHHAAAGEGGAFLEMQVGHQQRILSGR